MDFEALPGNLARVREEITRILAREGLTGQVRIIGVTKGHAVTAARAACAAGLTDLGENRVREALPKLAELRDCSITWHLIGHLQTNKAKFVPAGFAMVHSVDSVRLAQALARAVEQQGDGVSLPVLVQVNVAREPQKSGCDPDKAQELVGHVAALPQLKLEGLMTMAPFTDDETEQRAVFGKLRCLRDDLARGGPPLPELSMGMSSDYWAAVAEGATMIRLGTILFGERPT